MKSEFHFDQFIKEQFSEASVDVPSHILENVLAARRRSKPKGFWLTFLTGTTAIWIGVLLLLTGSGIYLYDVTKEKQSNIPESQNQKTYPANKSGGNDIGNAKKDNSSVSQPIDQNTNNTDPVTNTIDPVTNNNIPGNSAQPAIKKVSNRSLVKSFYNINPDQPTTYDDKVMQGTNNSDATDKSITITNSHLILPFTNENAKSIAVNKLNSRMNLKLPDCPTIESNAAGNKKYWEVYAGPDHVFGNYKTFGDTASYNYLQKRKASTTQTSAFSAGARYTRVYNNGMSVRTGLNYSQVNEKFDYVNLNEIRYITVITTRVIVRSPGDTVFINDTLQYQQTGTRTKTTYNRYHNIDIPLVVGYELGNDRIHANINAGVIINVYAWYKGDLLDTLNQPVSITTGKGNSPYQFRTNIGVGFLTSASVYYKITDKLHLLIEPYFRYNLSPMSKANLNLQQKFHTVGVRAGIRMDLK